MKTLLILKYGAICLGVGSVSACTFFAVYGLLYLGNDWTDAVYYAVMAMMGLFNGLMLYIHVCGMIREIEETDARQALFKVL